jgi:hypothetical protein
MNGFKEASSLRLMRRQRMLKAKLRGMIDAHRIVEIHFDDMNVAPLEPGDPPIVLDGVLRADFETKEVTIAFVPVRKLTLEKLDA